MGTDFHIARIEEREFIDLHKWPISDDIANCMFDAYDLTHDPYEKYAYETMADICTSPVVRVPASDIDAALCALDTEGLADYIPRLIPAVREFLRTPPTGELIIVSDLGNEPWSPDQPVWYEWQEIIAAFDFHARFLPRNLVGDHGFKTWEEVLAFYEENEAWFLHEQCSEELNQLKVQFERCVAGHK
jgi:hypothetical protein